MEAFALTYLLDTHALVWAFEGGQALGSKSRKALQEAGAADLAISDLTLLELALLIERGKIVCRVGVADCLSEAERQCCVLPVTSRIAAMAAGLDLVQGDPFDRVIVATAKEHDLTLITKDRRIVASKIAPTLW